MSQSRYDVVVVGSGIGGLTCGALLARAGMRVLVLEKHSKIGGYAHSFRRKQYTFESGIHSVPMGPNGLVFHLLKLLGVDQLVQTQALPSMYHVDIPGLSYSLPLYFDDFARSLKHEFPGEVSNLARLLGDMRQFYTVLAEPIFNFEREFREEDVGFLSKYHNLSVQDYISSFVADERLRQVFYSMWPYAGSPPNNAPTVFYVMMFVIHLMEGSHCVKGGFGALAAALAQAIQTRGGEVRTRSEVVRLDVEQGRARRAVLATGEEIEADLFVSNISPYTLHRSLIAQAQQISRRNLWLKRLDNLRPSISCMGVYLGMKQDVSDIIKDTITFWFGTRDHTSVYRNALIGGVNPLDHLILLSTGAERGLPTLTLMQFMDGGASADWRQEKSAKAELMLNTAERLYPGMRSLVDVMEVGSPDTFSRYTGNTGGALYGFENTKDMYGEAKLPGKTYINNLYQTGHWGKPGGGIWNVMYNAYAASKVIERDGNSSTRPRATPPAPRPMRVRLIYPRFVKFLEGHAALQHLVKEHLVGDYTMPPSLALPIIAAITPKGVEVALTDDNIGQPIDFDEKVDLVAITAFTPQAQRAYEIADEFRKRGVKVILGGIHPTGRPQEAQMHADAVCVGEVEPVWNDVLADLRRGALKPLYRAAEGYDLANLPIPRRELFSRDAYKWDAHLVLVTRGCPVRCDGCPIPGKEGVRLRYRPIDNVVEDIRSMPYREFYLTDDTVMIPGKKNMRYLLSLMERTRELNASIFLASTMMMVDDPAFYRALAAGGATSIYTVFGFDRSSRRLLSRDCTAEEWQRGVDLVRTIEDAGLHFFGSFGIGFDDQDPGVFDRILRFTQEARIDLAEFFIHTPFPGTPFGQRMEQEGRILHRNYSLWNTGNVVFRPAHFTGDELLQGFYSLWGNFYTAKKPQRTLRSFDVKR